MPSQNWRPPMKILTGLIRRQLQLEANKLGHCAVYEKELRRVWPLDEKNRKAKIEQFAKNTDFGWRSIDTDFARFLKN
jgi:hypothetical protein